MMTTTVHRTSVEMHVATHADGTREFRTVEIRTDLDDYIPRSDVEGFDDADCEYVAGELDRIHDAYVQRAQLDADHRARAIDWAATNGWSEEFDAVADIVLKSIRETA